MLKLSLEQPGMGVYVLCAAGGCVIGVQCAVNRALRKRMDRLELLLAACEGANSGGDPEVLV